MNKESILGQLRWSLQALACQADAQMSLYPDFVCQADELVLDFAHWRDVAISNFGSEFTPESLRLLADIDTKLSEMSRKGSLFHEELWTPEGLRRDPNWEEIRATARAALQSFDWPVENPGPSTSIYVPSKVSASKKVSPNPL